MTAESLPFVPPAPTVHATDLSVWRLLWKITRSTLSIWPDYAFDKLYIRNRVLGVETITISDPEGVRHVLTANAGNYRRPYSVTRIARPLVGSGLFLAEGADWRRQRRLLAPTFTPATIGLLLPHFRDAGLHMLRSIEMSPRANLSKVFQDSALEAVLRALFSLPESGNREKLRHMVRDYIEGPGRPTLIDGFARSENTFAFANAKRVRFRKYWRAAIDQIISGRKASPTAPSHRDLLGLLLGVRDAETDEALSDGEIRDQCATLFLPGPKRQRDCYFGPAIFWRWTLTNRPASAKKSPPFDRNGSTAPTTFRTGGGCAMCFWRLYVSIRRFRKSFGSPRDPTTFAAKELAPTRRCGSVHG
jgi:cytochrome P450